MKKIKVGVIGLGCRGSSLLKHILMQMDTIEVTAVCDEYYDRVQKGVEIVKNACEKTVYGTTDATELIYRNDVEAVLFFQAGSLIYLLP